MFGFKLITQEQYDQALRNEYRIGRLFECRRWFSGWPDLEHIFAFVLDDGYYGGISTARRAYANDRKTDEYGSPK